MRPCLGLPKEIIFSSFGPIQYPLSRLLESIVLSSRSFSSSRLIKEGVQEAFKPGFSESLKLDILKEKVSKRPAEKTHRPIPILGRRTSNAGYVAKTLSEDPKKISKSELKRWLKTQSFDQSQLEIYVTACKQTSLKSALLILESIPTSNEGSDRNIPSSILAEIASKRIQDRQQLDDLLILLGHRIAIEEDVMIVSHLLNGAVQASLSVGHLVASTELVEYSTRYASEIARVEVEKTNTQSANDDDSKHGVAQDPSLAIRPLLACIAALMNRPVSQSHGPTCKLITILIKHTIDLCGSLESVFGRLSKPNIHLLSRAIISSMLSPDGHPFKLPEINLLLRQKLPPSTLRLGMTCMIQAGRRDQADRFERRLLDHGNQPEDLPFKYQLNHALKFHHLPKLALRVWEHVTHIGMRPDAAALQVVMTVLIDLDRSHEAVYLFRQHSRPGNDHQPPIVGSSSGNIQVLATYARALDLAGHHSDVYHLWKTLKSDWNLEPDERIFGALISSARKLALASVSEPSNNMLQVSSDHLSDRPQRETSDDWDGRPAAEVAIRLFWSILYQNWPNIAQTVSAPLRTASIWNGVGVHELFLSRVRGLSPPSHSAQSRNQTTKSIEKLSTAETVIPSLQYSLDWPMLIPTRYSFRDQIELLGICNQSHYIPLLLGWMKALKIKPDQDLILRGYYWIYQISSPIQNRLNSLDLFIEDWIQEFDGLKVVVPTDRMMELHYLDRFKWKAGFFNGRTKVGDWIKDK
ncbi:uncharacterized protein MELLADRAFT_116876 [Melampsora larici-populina 98AG31]|uniref:Uncharacterized protein n=1 Tax=Melampsora larici-populina (strain 98AG31 / pathotype 3-4-7) TaxID=747676 RepID=F4RQX8_MELLP|nr:uncharacterized protein MELLADRAFT_116876 [Melampsora larici-populina 98AG31]EGG05245.1 hypothetical protein MELLADRAFT_116876 [Melampsora larici-populina 98AG31]